MNAEFQFKNETLTAYALRELDDVQMRQVEAYLASHPELLPYVEEIRKTADLLSAEMGRETKPHATLSLVDIKSAQERIVRAAEPREPVTSSQRITDIRKGFRRIAIGSVGLATAATLALVMSRSNFKMRSQVADSAATYDTFAMPEESSRLALKKTEKSFANSGGGAGSMAPLSPAAGIQHRSQVITGVGGVPRGLKDARDNEDLFEGSENYSASGENEFRFVKNEPLSTFSIDVDTASYSNARRFLMQIGSLPPVDAVRAEEFINYFPYEYPAPSGDQPFAVHVEQAASPFSDGRKLVRVGLKGRDIDWSQRVRSNLVFLLDVSGSMEAPNKLPLLKQSLRLLVDQLRDDDRIAIVVYAGASGLVLPSTPGSKKDQILSALERLNAGGSTNGAAGIELAYKTVRENFVKGGVNRVILATDGDFNVGTTSEGDLVRLIEREAKSGAFLTVLGFGMGNYKDSTLEKLADKGNGNYGYIDELREAKKMLVEQVGGTMVTIAKDVKIQVEFNPAKVAAYRLIGYENRLLNKEDFNDDTKDAGEIGAGHTVTALYEIIPVGGKVPVPAVDELRYQAKSSAPKSSGESKAVETTGGDELLFVKLRYKAPEGDTSKLIEQPLRGEERSFKDASSDFKFASAAAGFAMWLKDSKHKGSVTPEWLIETAENNLKVKGQVDEYRDEFVRMVRKAKELKH